VAVQIIIHSRVAIVVYGIFMGVRSPRLVRWSVMQTSEGLQCYVCAVGSPATLFAIRDRSTVPSKLAIAHVLVALFTISRHTLQVIAIILKEIGLDLGWVYLFMVRS
jgi:hypothetical protein